MFKDIKTFYPTPKALISKMISKVKGSPNKILEPSAGKGDIVDALTKEYSYGNRRHQLSDVYAIELEEDLQATLRGKGIRVIDSDFLTFAGPDKFDLIIMNPPFDDGDKHLLKAINIMYRGEIVCLLNAETIKNQCTNTRKELVKQLDNLNAEIEYLQLAFRDAERPTDVDVALVYINIERKVEDDLFKDCDDTAEAVSPEIERNHEVSTGRTIEELVAEYNQIVTLGTDTIVGYYRNYKKIGKYIGLNKEADKDYSFRDEDMTAKMQNQLNDMLTTVRTDFWRRTLDIQEVNRRLTSTKQSEFEHQLTQHCHMDFTERNIRQFILNIITGTEKTLTDAVLEIFDRFTIRHCYSDGVCDDNIHYFNGWKTNKAYKVNKKVIIPIYAGYGSGPFLDDYSKQWKLQYGAQEVLRDIDVVMSYFDGGTYYRSISNALENAFNRGQSTKIRSTYFTLTAYKKGTLHLTFNDDDILRRFNVTACKGKGWLPHDYGKKAYSDFEDEEKSVVDSFEGVLEYNKNLNKPLFAPTNNILRLTSEPIRETETV